MNNKRKYKMTTELSALSQSLTINPMSYKAEHFVNVSHH